jgi:AmmeMemoRadiSam system protein A
MVLSGALRQPQGAFVTLSIRNKLRGCIGYIESVRPLGEVVREVAAKAACADPRFPPLTLAEFQEVTLEISVLSTLRPVKGPEEISVGEHGLMLELGSSRGLLLPQVATQYGWGAEEFLNAVARKAGLPVVAWKNPDVRLFTFTAEIFRSVEEVASAP